MRNYLLLLCMIIFAASSAHATCSTASLSPHSEIVADGESMHSDYGTVSEGTILVDAADLKRKKCASGQWQILPYDGINVTSAHPGMDRFNASVFLDASKRSAVYSVGALSCGDSSGTGFLFDLSEFGVPENRDFDVVATSCHVVAGRTCRFLPVKGFHAAPRPGLEHIAAQLGPEFGDARTIAGHISENGCQEFLSGNPRTNKRTAKKDWYFAVLDRKINVPDARRIKIVEGDHDAIDRYSKNEDLVVFGIPAKRVQMQFPGSAQLETRTLPDLVYSRQCKGDLKADNIVHNCMTFPGMSGGPIGYYGRDGRFHAFGINSWASDLNKDLGSKKAAQISRGGATALSDDVFRVLRVKLRDL